MSEADEIWFACIGCGTMNSSSAEVCAGCGHRSAGPEPTPAESPSRPGPFNPYQPPLSRIAPPTTFRIGSGLTVIALIAVCLAALRANTILGIMASVSLIPAGVRTPLVSGRRRSEGRPMTLEDRMGTFTVTMFATWVVVIWGLITFGATCVIIGLFTGNFWVSLICGAMGGIGSGVWLIGVFIDVSRENAAREREIRYY